MSNQLPSDVRGRLKAILEDQPDQAMETICVHISAGGSLITLCETWGVSYWRVIRWIRTDTARAAQYSDALLDRDEWAKERILDELRCIATADLSQAYHEDGRLKLPKDWPEPVKRWMAGLETREEIQEDGTKTADVLKIKQWDKMKALELYGKKLGLFVEKHEHTGNLTLEQLIMGSFDHSKKGE